MEQSKSQRIVVMTGVTGGFGVYALQRIAAQPVTRVIIGARGSNRTVPAGVEVLPLDLASLTSVRQFAEAVIQEIGDSHIDILVLNAGIHTADTSNRSEDGFELTFAVNHLAHYLLARLLLPHITDRGRLVITTSNMHEPPLKRIAPKTVEPQLLALPTESGSGIKAYSSSKLCNLMTAQSIDSLPDVRARHIDVVAFNPGLTGGSSGRDSSRLARMFVSLLMHTVFRLIGLFRPEFIMNSPEHSGRMLADVSLGIIKPPSDRLYLSLVKGQPTFPDPSELARNQEAQDRLWRESAAMVGLE
ncbi:short chain dehydrogenase [Gimesia chilikensis]|uniref:Short chain dehydrogenase n=1 Tax=Gimesia chilikensis TaxID=2605989 RepID=A0A517WGW1_9PLAN|nr:SDR family NAD(P)-dependent oxidoreductase [Gimesia chilikensis]QDU04482.1 short chain dehydrogenase [Gimesia chilikensis]